MAAGQASGSSPIVPHRSKSTGSVNPAVCEHSQATLRLQPLGPDGGPEMLPSDTPKTSEHDMHNLGTQQGLTMGPAEFASGLCLSYIVCL